MKSFLIFIAAILGTFGILSDPYRFSLTVPFQVDDFDEYTTNLNVSAISDNTNLVPNSSISVGRDVDLWCKLLLISDPDIFGDTKITISVCDNGYVANRSKIAMMSLTPSPTTNLLCAEYPLDFTLTSYSNKIYLNWVITNLLEVYGTTSGPIYFKVNRFSTNNLYNFDKHFTVGYTTNTSFLDTNGLAVGSNYCYSLSWLSPKPSTSRVDRILCTNVEFTLRVRKPIQLVPTLYGMAFNVESNKPYRIFFKTNAYQMDWEVIRDVMTNKNCTFILSAAEYDNKLIYIREIEQQ